MKKFIFIGLDFYFITTINFLSTILSVLCALTINIPCGKLLHCILVLAGRIKLENTIPFKVSISIIIFSSELFSNHNNPSLGFGYMAIMLSNDEVSDKRIHCGL